MRTTLPDDVVAFGKAARARFAAMGAQYALAAENDPSLVEAAGGALEELGAFELSMKEPQEWLAACELLRVAGSVALPYPVAERILAVEGAWLAVIDPGAALVDHAALAPSWIAVNLAGRSFTATAVADEQRRKLAPFVRRVELADSDVLVEAGDVERWLVLGAWRVLGTLETALAQVTEHVKARVQFGKALAEFQAVRFALADAVVAVRGLSELTRFTAWRVGDPDAGHGSPVGGASAVALADALALRIYAADTARAVMRTCHQLLGAVGFCDEHDVSVLDRHLQATTRLPMPAERLVELLVPCVANESFQTLFTSRMS